MEKHNHSFKEPKTFLDTHLKQENVNLFDKIEQDITGFTQYILSPSGFVTQHRNPELLTWKGINKRNNVDIYEVGFAYTKDGNYANQMYLVNKQFDIDRTAVIIGMKEEEKKLRVCLNSNSSNYCQKFYEDIISYAKELNNGIDEYPKNIELKAYYAQLTKFLNEKQWQKDYGSYYFPDPKTSPHLQFIVAEDLQIKFSYMTNSKPSEELKLISLGLIENTLDKFPTQKQVPKMCLEKYAQLMKFLKEKKYISGETIESLNKYYHDIPLPCSCAVHPQGTDQNGIMMKAQQEESNESKGGTLMAFYNRENLWKPDDKKLIREIRVMFLETDQKDKNDMVLRIAKKWEKYASSIRFVDVTEDPQQRSDVRISYKVPKKSYSWVGVAESDVEVTMNLGWFENVNKPNKKEYERTTLHEFGHVLGLYHELQHPLEEVPWDLNKVISMYVPPFTNQEAQSNILNALDSSIYEGKLESYKKLDPLSIMCYTINKDALKEDFKAFPGKPNHKISYIDRYMIRRAYHYELWHFQAGFYVEMLPLYDVVKQFSIVHRTDFNTGAFLRCSGKMGKILATHCVNGVLVQFESDQIWLEPECLIPPFLTDEQIIPDPSQDRLFPNTIVRYIDNEKRGYVRPSPHESIKYDEKSQSFTGLDQVYVDFGEDTLAPIYRSKLAIFTKDEEPVIALNPKIKKLRYCNQDLSAFSMHQQVKVKSKEDIMNSLEYADRHYTKEYENIEGASGIVLGYNLTNGLLVSITKAGKGQRTLWLEPASLEEVTMKNPEDSVTSTKERFLVNQIIIVINRQHQLYNKQGRVIMHGPSDDAGSSISAIIEDKVEVLHFQDVVLFSDFLFGNNIVDNEDVAHSLLNQVNFQMGEMDEAVLKMKEQQKFLKDLCQSMFGFDSDEHVLLPMPPGHVITLKLEEPGEEGEAGEGKKVVTTKISEEDMCNYLQGNLAATPAKDYFLPNMAANIHNNVEGIFRSLIDTKTVDMPKEVKAEVKALLKEKERLINKANKYEVKIASAISHEGKKRMYEQVDSMWQDVDQVTTTIKNLQNQYGNGVLEVIRSRFLDRENITSIFPRGLDQIINKSASYVKQSYEYNVDQNSTSTSKKSLGGKGGYLFFGSGGGDTKKKETNAASVFSKFTLQFSFMTGFFDRPWFDEILFDLENIAVKDKGRGFYSNGKMDNIQGPLSIIPQKFIIMKGIKIICEKRNHSERTFFEESKGKGEINIGFWKVSASGDSIEKSTGSSTIYSKLVLESESPTLFGLICRKMPEFPKVGWEEYKNSKIQQNLPEVQHQVEDAKMQKLTPQQEDLFLNSMQWQQIMPNIWEYDSYEGKTVPKLRYNTLDGKMELDVHKGQLVNLMDDFMPDNREIASVIEELRKITEQQKVIEAEQAKVLEDKKRQDLEKIRAEEYEKVEQQRMAEKKDYEERIRKLQEDLQQLQGKSTNHESCEAKLRENQANMEKQKQLNDNMENEYKVRLAEQEKNYKKDLEDLKVKEEEERKRLRDPYQVYNLDFPDGVYSGQIWNSQRNGQGKLISGDNTYEGEWRDNILNGPGKWWNKKKGESYEGNWKNGQMDGIGKYEDESGYEVPYTGDPNELTDSVVMEAQNKMFISPNVHTWVGRQDLSKKIKPGYWKNDCRYEAFIRTKKESKKEWLKTYIGEKLER